MAPKRGKWSDEWMDGVIGGLLRAGVVLSAAIVAFGGIVFLWKYGATPFRYETFRGEPAELRSVSGVLKEAAALRGRGLVQLGLLMLIATPVARVVFSIFAFALQRDRTYVVITLIVLAILLYSLASGGI